MLLISSSQSTDIPSKREDLDFANQIFKPVKTTTEEPPKEEKKSDLLKLAKSAVIACCIFFVLTLPPLVKIIDSYSKGSAVVARSIQVVLFFVLFLVINKAF